MRDPIQPDFNQDDLSTYNDEKVAIFLRELQEKSLEDLLKIQMKIGEEYAKATEEYEAERTTIRWARRRYWALIFVGVFREIWRALQGKESNISKLKKRKADLKAQYAEQDEAYNTQMSLVHNSIESIQMYANEVTQRMAELNDLNVVIENLDATYYQLTTTDPQDKLEIEQQLTRHIEQRDILSGYINELCNKTETLISALAGLLDNFQPDYLPKDFLSKYRAVNSEKISAIKDRCKEIEHPIVSKLLTFLTRQTAKSLQELQIAIAKDKTLFDDRLLADILWEANTLYPAIFLGKNREQLLFEYVTLQESELASLQEVIEATDEQLQGNDHAETRRMLNHLIEQRAQLSAQIGHLLLLHRDVLSGNHAALLDRVHFLARQQNENALVSDLMRDCDKLRHPITKALHYFLTYRTNASLRVLKSVMESDPSYLESRDLVCLIEKAGAIDPRITEGWVKEEELPSIKEIQQSYIKKVSDRLDLIERELDDLTDHRIVLSSEIHDIQAGLDIISKEYTQISGHLPTGYVPRKEVDELKRDGGRYARFQKVKGDYLAQDRLLKSKKAELTQLNAVIREKEATKEHCVIEPVLFTPEVLYALIKKCNEVKRLGFVHPVAAALSRFLNYPTPSLLTKLKFAMQEHPDYQKNEKLNKLLTEANQYFPYIRRESVPDHQHMFEFFHENRPEVGVEGKQGNQNQRGQSL